VRIGRQLTNTFLTSSGVRQGRILAPMLFCLAIDWIMSRCTDMMGIKVGDSIFTDIDYADDALLFTDDYPAWPSILSEFDLAASTMGLHTSWAKTKVQNTASDPPPTTCTISGHQVEAVTKFTFSV